MSRTFDSTSRALFRTEANKEEQGPLLHLVTFMVPQVGTNPAVTIHLVDANNDITYNGITYTAFPLQFDSGHVMSSDGSTDGTSLTLANPERIFMGYVNKYKGLRKTSVTVKTIFQKHVDFIYQRNAEGVLITPLPVNPLHDDSAYIEDFYTVDSYIANEQTLKFVLLPSSNFDVQLPRGRFNANSCRFRYKDAATCKYNGDLPSCKKDLTACKEHANVANYGGFPGVPRTTRYIIL